MEITLHLPIKQVKYKPDGKERDAKDLYRESFFRVLKKGDISEVYNHEQQLLCSLTPQQTAEIFRTSRTEYPAVYNYETGVLTIVKWVSLHGHSAYSILDCISKPEDIAKKSEWAMAVTDHGNMFGILKFYKAMKKEGKKPILGFEAYTSSLDYQIEVTKSENLRSFLKNHPISLEQLIQDNPQVMFLNSEKETLVCNGGVFEFIEHLKKLDECYVKAGQIIKINRANMKNHLVLLAENEKGYQNLVKLTSIGHQKFTKGRPQIDWDDLRQYSEGVVALSACLAGELPRAIMRRDMEQARRIIREMISIFGKENYFIEIQRHGLPEEDFLNPILMKLAKEFGLKVVATSDNHYTNKEDAYAHEAHLAIGTKSLLSDPNRWTFNGTGYHIHSSSEMEALFEDVPEVLDNTLELAERLTCEIPMGKIYMPEFPLPKGFSSQSEYFEFLVKKGFEERFKGKPEYTNPEYKERLQFEMDVINNMQFPGYFLIVADFINFAKRNYHLVDEETASRWKKFIQEKGHDVRPLAVGPGRGSACGSLVAYCLNITNVDPIPYGLLFERFLNPDRISMPDIDTDFPDTRREEVLEYVRDLYGVNSVSGIVTFGSMNAKSVCRDVARVMGFPPSFGDMIAKTIPDKLEENGENVKVTLPNALRLDLGFAQLYNNNPDVKKVVDLAMRLEGLPRNTSTHACGYVVTDGNVTNYIPQASVLNNETKERDMVTQFTMGECEEVGLLKMDFLGLRTMGVIDATLEQVNNDRQKQSLAPLNLDTLMTEAVQDINTYRHISQGHTAGVFQLESAGMTEVMKQLYQDVNGMTKGNAEQMKELFERLVAGLSLYRPGPMDEIPNYINNMLDPDGILYDSPELKDILSATYNVIVYQEQVMFIVRELAGFSRGQSDNIRKAMGKKKKEIIDQYEDYFLYGNEELGIEGCQKRKIPMDLAKDIWERMKKFAEYAFNKSHAAGYAYVSAITAYLNFYYPVETMTATLNSFKNKADRIKQFIGVCKARGIEVLPPNVNSSKTDFTVEDGKIRFGFSGLRNMGKSGQFIIEEREQRGEFKSLFDFVQRMALNQKVDKRMMESLIYSGSLDEFEGTRKEKLFLLDSLLGIATVTKELKKERMTSILSTLTFVPIQQHILQAPPVGELEFSTKMMKEKEYTGFYVTGHPIDQYLPKLSKVHINGLNKIHAFVSEEEEVIRSDGEVVERQKKEMDTRLVGVVQEMELFLTRKGEQMASFEIEDETGVIKAVMFPKTYQMYSLMVKEGNVLSFGGRVTYGERGTQFIVQLVETIEELASNNDPEYIQLTLSDDTVTAQMEVAEIEHLLQQAALSGITNHIPIVFSMNGQLFTKRKGRVMKGNCSGDTIRGLEYLLGKGNVYVKY